MEKLFLVTNPGSSSRKYALYHDDESLICALHFETEDKTLICTLKRADGSKVKFTEGFKRIADTIRFTSPSSPPKFPNVLKLSQVLR